MTTRTAAREADTGGLLGRYNVLHGGAVILHGLSYLTTLWFVQWIAPGLALSHQGITAYILEFALFSLKKALYGRTPFARSAGWFGVTLDGAINAGGLLPSAPRILTFPPLAAVGAVLDWGLAQLGVSLGWMHAPMARIEAGQWDVDLTIAVLLTAIVFGMLLSSGPAQLWEAAERER